MCSGGNCDHPAGNDGAACASDGDPCTNDVCSGGVCDHPPKCLSYCCGSGTCCDQPCETCLDNGTLDGSSAIITVSPATVCLGDSMTFTVSGVVDSGGIMELDCEAKTPIPPVAPDYTWTITKPDTTTTTGSGATAAVTTTAGGTYSCTFTATANRDCPPPDVTVGPASATAVELTSQTLATTPANRTRTTLGIGEIVTISTNPATTVAWSLVGGGSLPLPPPPGTSILLTAGMSPSTSTTTATLLGGATCDIVFTVIAPSGMTCAVSSETGCGVLGPPDNTIGSRTLFDCTVQPTTVSFYNTQFRENIPGDAWTWPDGTADSWPATVEPWIVSQANEAIDDVEMCGDPIAQLDPPPPGGGYVNFSVNVRVPEEYLNDSSTWVQWLPETQTQEYRGADAASRGIINATNTATGAWQGPWQ